jgi:putative acetyltransferase
MAPYTLDIIQRWINNIPSSIPLIAECNGKIVGFATVHRFQHQRRKEVGDLAIYLHQDFHNVGLGTVMTEKPLQLTKKEGMHKLELTVVEDNKAAIHVYEKFGFKIEGISKDSFFGFDGKYHAMIHMGLILD